MLPRRGCNMSHVMNWAGAFPAPHVINRPFRKGKHTSGGLAHCWHSECPHLVSAVCRSQPAASPHLRAHFLYFFSHPAWQKDSLLFLLLWLHYRRFLPKNHLCRESCNKQSNQMPSWLELLTLCCWPRAGLVGTIWLGGCCLPPLT